ncbi:unnamed protein product [Closterium sp. NIES-54]
MRNACVYLVPCALELFLSHFLSSASHCLPHWPVTLSTEHSLLPPLAPLPHSSPPFSLPFSFSLPSPFSRNSLPSPRHPRQGVTASPLTKRTVTTLAHALLVVALALLLGNWQRISQGSFLLESLPFKAFNFGEAPLPPLHRSGPVCRTCDRASCSFAYLQGLTNLLTLVPPLSGAHSMAAKWAKFQMPSLSDADDLPDGVVIQIVASDWSVVAAPEGDWSQPLGLEKVGGQEGSRVGDVLTVVVVKTSEPNR